MTEQKPMWQTVKEIEERMTTFGNEAVVSAIFGVIAKQNNMAFGLWSYRDIANRIYEHQGWSYEHQEVVEKLAKEIWEDIVDELYMHMNDFAILQNVNITDRIVDALEEEGVN